MEVKISISKIIGTGVTVYEAWTPTSGDHSTIRSFSDDSRRWGKIGTGKLPMEIEDLAVASQQRIDAVAAWQESNNLLAFAYIIANHAVCASASAKRSGSSIEVCDV